MMTQQNGNPGSGNLVAQPGNGPVTCGPARYFLLNLGGVQAPYDLQTRVFAIWSLAVGQTATLLGTFAPNRSDCTLLEFDPKYGGDPLTVSRIDDGTGPRKWIVKSQGTHTAA